MGSKGYRVWEEIIYKNGRRERVDLAIVDDDESLNLFVKLNERSFQLKVLQDNNIQIAFMKYERIIPA